jgi:hypothetical protein
MIRASRGYPLSDDDRAVNRVLSRAHVEHPYAVIRRTFHFTKMYVTTRVGVRAMFMCMSFNLMSVAFLLRPRD